MKQQIQAAELAESLLGSGLVVRLRVFGSSMKPLLRAGSLVRIAPCSDPRVGDVLLYKATSGRLIAHRLIGYEGQKYRTKGDASGEPDGLVGRHQLLGKILGIEGPLFVPLDGPIARRFGMFLNRHYPRLVRLKSALKRLAGMAPRLAGGSS